MADVGALLTIALVGAGYEMGRAHWRAIAGRSMVSAGATTRFYSGLVVVAVAVASPLDIAADRSLPAHMTQHVLLLTLAAPLLASGLPMPTLLFALPGRARTRAIVQCRRFVRAHDRRYAAWVSGTLILQAAVMWGWHVPIAYDAAVRNNALHACEHLSFLLVATLSWWSVATGPRHLRGAGAIAALIGSVPGMLLGAAMVLAPNPWYPIYDAGGRAHALVEQQVAGVIMWGFGGMAVVITGAALFAAWLAGPARDSPAAHRRVAHERATDVDDAECLMTDTTPPNDSAVDGHERDVIAGRAGRWVDDRLNVSKFADSVLSHVFPDNWSFLLGEIAMYCFAILLLTGLYLTFFFHPGTNQVVYSGSYVPLRGVPMSEAYESTVRLSFDVRAGLVVRQIHHWTADIFAAAIVAHLCRIFFTGAFRRPREINWLIGVTMLILVIFNGFAGYSLPDDLLSATGLRIAYSILISIPFIGTWLASLFFGGQYPGPSTIDRLFIIHVLILPVLIGTLLAAHLAIIWRQKHSQFAASGRTERNVVGLRLWPTYAAKSAGLFAIVFALCAALGGLAQINPIWLYGPYRTGAVTTAAQPDWYMGWLEGALRLFPAWRIHIFHHTIPEVFWPGVVLPALTFALLFAWPFLEARVTHDHAEHHLLDRPRFRPVRTSIGTGVLAFYIVLFGAGSQDIFAQHLDAPIPTVDRTFRILLLVAPIVTAAVTWRWCHDLARESIREAETPPAPWPPPHRDLDRVS